MGIELAASWVRGMSCTEIADQLAQDADFLTSSLRNLPTRHRSLGALFERSWQLLTPAEQGVLRQLAIFRNGFDRRAAETVVEATPTVLAALLDKFLIRRSAGRFDMHGLLQRFVAEKLADVPQLQAQVGARHALFYADLAARAGWELQSGEDMAKKALPSESANLLAAWRWATETQNEAVIQRMVKPLAYYYDSVGWQDESRHAFAAAVLALRATQPNGLQAGLLGSLLLRVAKADPHFRIQERYTTLDEAVRLLEQATPQDDLELALAYGEFAIAGASLGHNQGAIVLLEKALAFSQSAGSTLGEGHTTLRLGLVKFGWGRAREATVHFERAIRLLEHVDDDAVLRCTHILGGILLMRGFYQRAEKLLQQALTYAVANRRTLRIGSIMRELAELKTFTGNFSDALSYYQEAYAHFEPLNLRAEVINGMLLSPGVLARLCGAADAEQQLIDAVATARRIGFKQRLATAIHHLSRFRHDQSNYEGALALLDEALTIARQIDFRYATSLILIQQGHSWVALGQPDQARPCYAEGLQLARDGGIDRLALDALWGVATLLEQAENEAMATTFFRLVHDHSASEYETRQRAAACQDRMSQETSVAGTAEERIVDNTFDLAEAIRVALQWLC
ncbi:MAG: tetratricopeptide repeat protein [Caldilineaceae bacterium]